MGGRPSGCSPPPQNRNLKNTDIVDTMISKVLSNLHYSRSQSLKSADDQYIRILKKRLIKLKWTRRLDTVTESWNVQLNLYVYKCNCKLTITALFWVITQRVVVISYRRFGTTYRSHLRLEDGTDRSSASTSRRKPEITQCHVYSSAYDMIFIT